MAIMTQQLLTYALILHEALFFLVVLDTQLLPEKQQDHGGTFYLSQNFHPSKFFSKGLGHHD